MGRDLCFCIEGKELYLEQILVDYENIPIFFLCKGGSQYYVALCTDLEVFHYIVVFAENLKVYNLLHGNHPMRDIFLGSGEYWEIVSGDDVSMDTVIKHPAIELDVSVLPQEGACFEILTEEMRLFVQSFDETFLQTKFVKKEDIIEEIDFFQVPLEGIGQFDVGIPEFFDLYNAYVKAFIEESMGQDQKLLGEYIPYSTTKAKVQENEIGKTKTWKEDDTILVAA